jgi:hypothetical protein
VKHIKYEIISLIHSKSYDQVFDQTDWQIRNFVVSQLWSGVEFQIWDQVGNQICWLVIDQISEVKL